MGAGELMPADTEGFSSPANRVAVKNITCSLTNTPANLGSESQETAGSTWDHTRKVCDLTGFGNLDLISPGSGDPLHFKSLGFGSDLGEGGEVVLKNKPGYSNSMLR